MKKNKFSFYIFTIIMLILNLFVCPNINGPYIELNIIILLLNLVYLIISIKKRKLIINKKVDLLVLLFFFSSFIPIFTKSYVSLYDQYNSVMQNLSLIIFYIFVRNISYKNEYKIINILIYSSVPVIIIAFDRINSNLIWNILSKINIFKVVYEESGILANFNYPNSLAIYLSAISILLLSQIINGYKSHKKDVISRTYFVILLVAIALTLSKASIILFGITLLIYLLFNNKTDRKTIVSIILLSGFTLIIEFGILMFVDNIILKVILQIILFVLLLKVNYNKLSDKFNLKKIFSVIFIFIVSAFIYILCVVNYSKPIYIYGEKAFETSKIDNKNNYNIKIDLNGIKNNNNTNNFNIKIYAIFKDGSSIEAVDDSFEKHKGIKEYNIITEKKVYYLRFTFKNIDIYDNNEFIINNILIDNKEFIINYKFIPNVVGNIINNNLFNSRSVIYRKEYYKNAYSILNDTTIFGNGFNSWKYLYMKNRTFDYITVESHSYLIDIFLDFGIVSVILLLLIYIMLFRNILKILKNKNNNYKTILAINLSVLLVLIHSLFDFNMSFLLVKFLVFILIILLSSYDDKDNFVEYKCVYFINILLSLILLIINISNMCGIFTYNKYKKINILDYENYVQNKNNYLDRAISLFPCNKFMRFEKITNSLSDNKSVWNDIIDLKTDENYYNQLVIYKMLSKEVFKELKDGNIDINKIRLLDNFILEDYGYNKYEINSIVARTELLVSVYDNYMRCYEKYNNEVLKNEIEKIHDKIMEEYVINNKYLSDKTTKQYETYKNLVDSLNNEEKEIKS